MSENKKQSTQLTERMSTQLAMIDYLATEIGKDSPVTVFILHMAKQNLFDEQGTKPPVNDNLLPKS